MTTLIIILFVLTATALGLYYGKRMLLPWVASGNEEPIQPQGEFKMWVQRGGTGKKELVVSKPNTIDPDLKAELAKLLDVGTNDFAMDNLFPSQWHYGQLWPGDGDGIRIGTERRCITTSIAASNTYGKRFKGEYTFDEAASITNAAIGQGATGGSPMNFAIFFATNTFAQVDVLQSDKIIIEWEIYIP